MAVLTNVSVGSAYKYNLHGMVTLFDHRFIRLFIR